MSELAARVRSERRLWAAPGSSHDSVVNGLKIVLPVAVGVLLAFLVTAPVLVGGDVSFVLDKNKVEIARERMRVQSAIYRGQDDKGQRFALRAGSAVQKSSSEPIVQLNQLSAEIDLAEGPATLNAQHGRYNIDQQQVALDSPVKFKSANGYQLDATSGTIDLKTRQLRSDGPVSGAVPQGNFSAGAMSADLENHVVRLEGRARLRINPRRAR